MIPPYLAVLRSKAHQKKWHLHVVANNPRQAATVAAEHWLRDGADLTSGASIQVHRYHADGRVDPSVLFRLAARAVERKQRKATTRTDELLKRRQSLEASRSEAIQRMEQHLASGQIARRDLDALKVEFEAAAEHNHGPEAFLSLDGPPSLRGSATLKSRALADRAALAVNRLLGDGAWKVWLEILLGYLLQNDAREFLAKSVITSRSLGCGLRIFEAYSIKQMLEASALCCSWLTTTVAGELLPELVADLADSSAPVAGLAANSALNEAAANPQRGSEDSRKLFVSGSVRQQSQALEILRNAMEGQGLNPSSLARKITVRLRSKRERTAKFDRSTMYRLLKGQTMKSHSPILQGIIEALELDWQSAEIVRREFGTLRPERSPKSAFGSRG